MTEVTEDRLLRKLEDVERAINDINLSIAEKLGETKACRAKCEMHIVLFMEMETIWV